ncbi:hypothetical protein [Candidatus Phyllobacterium onerii]|uniref:hypothetical protein n=1 Tax=Candidatus Phyllobacterium onerii TaxID=3020828 RepID=UPI00232D0F99|nr:hypothetical protein [Phyllobacterium sp. IY22]
MTPTPELVARANSIIQNGPPLELAIPRETIELRDANGIPAGYQDSPETKRMRQRLREMNEAIRATLFTGVLPGAMVRIFNRTFNRGGRFYALGGSWQSMNQEARKQITIGGEPVIEIDYKTLHPAILYAQAGAPLPDDCYSIDGWPRRLVKRALLILLNAKTRGKARDAIAHAKEMEVVCAPGTDDAKKAATELMGAIKSRHHRIASAFHTDKGAELMRLDSDLAESVMHVMMMAGVTVLPVHDSFLVQASQAQRLEETMLRIAYEAGFESLQVTSN